jgi:hypothetical protein
MPESGVDVYLASQTSRLFYACLVQTERFLLSWLDHSTQRRDRNIAVFSRVRWKAV